MSKNIKDLNPTLATHPGEVLIDELDARGIKQREFASELNIAVTQLNEIIKGKRSITPDFAVLLEGILGIDAQFWVNMQANYNLDLARIKKTNIEKKQILERWQVLKNYVAIGYFKKLGIIEGSPFNDEKAIQKIYKENSLEGIINQVTRYNYSLFKKSDKLNTEQINLISWVKLVEHKASDINVEVFDNNKIESLIIDLKKVFTEKDIVAKTFDLLAQAGIKLVILEHPEHVPVDGMSFWNDSNPAIGLTLRHNRLDNFAFTLFHEIGHIMLHLRNDKKEEFVDNIDEIRSSKDKIENEANDFASDNLINPRIWKELITTCFNYTDGVIENFAEKANVHPAILRGRICHEFNQYYKVKTRINNQIK